MTILATTTPTAVAGRNWDVVVIGAGPAGGSATLRLAKLGLQILLVESKSFPRNKVCGGCLNARSLALLAEQRITEPLEAAGAVPLEALQVRCGPREVTWPLPAMVAVSRQLLDATIVEQAIAGGAEFLPSTMAVVETTAAQDARTVILSQTNQPPVRVCAKLVLCADGLSRSSLRCLDDFASDVQPNSRLGLGAVVDDASNHYPAGRLTMAVGDEGYVGITRLERGRLNMAAAVAPDSLARARTADHVIRQVLASSDLPTPERLGTAHWNGTLPLTRCSTRLAQRRLFVLGDAAGYVEPFTGEGIAWALAAASDVVPYALNAVACWDDGLARGWERQLKQKEYREQWICRLISRLLKHPRMTRCAMTVCRAAPMLPRTLVSYVAG